MPTFFDRCEAFFETKVGFWLVTVVLVSVAGTGYASFQKWLDRDDIARREKSERSRRDTDTMLKLVPMLTSEKHSEVELAIMLLNGLATADGVDPEVAKQVFAWEISRATTVPPPDAPADQKQQFNALIAYIDQPRIASVKTADAEVKPSAAPTALSETRNLPARVYLQIGDKADQARAEAASAALKKAGLVAPGIELVPATSAPKVSDLRYCEGKIDADALDRVKAAAASAMSPAPTPVPLPAKMCGNVRFNHFEIWIARRS